MLDPGRNNHRWFPQPFSSYHHRRQSLSLPAMPSSTPSMIDVSDADRKLAESPAPSSQTQQGFGIVPETHSNRTLVLCFDGTGDKFDSDVREPFLMRLPTTSLIIPSCQNSNVVQFISLLKKDNKREQMVYYQARLPDRSYGRTLTLRTEDRDWHVCRETRSRILHPSCQEDVETVGRSRSLEPRQSHAVLVLDYKTLHLEIHGPFCQLVTNF